MNVISPYRPTYQSQTLPSPSPSIEASSPEENTASPTDSVDFRPWKEHWAVGQPVSGIANFRYSRTLGTSELLEQAAEIPKEGVRAIYQLQRDSDSVKPVTAGEYAGASLAGALAGGIGGAGLGLTLQVAGVILGVFSAGFLMPTGVAVGGVAAAGAALGAIVAPLEARNNRDSYQSYGELAIGTLRREPSPEGPDRLTFFPNNRADRPVDLQDYSQAPSAPSDPGQKAWWDDAVHSHNHPLRYIG